MLSGCSTAKNADIVPVEAKPAAPTQQATTADPIAFCGVFVTGMQDYVTFILDSASADVNESAYRIQLSRMEKMDEIVPADMKATLAQYGDPVYQIKSVVDAGGGNINFTTDGFKTANLEIMQYCVEEGYRAG